MKRPRVVELHVRHDDEELILLHGTGAMAVARARRTRGAYKGLRKFVATAD
jgi:hypothetical protein